MSALLDSVQTFENVFTEQQFKKIWSYIEKPHWSAVKSRTDSNDFLWGMHNLANDDFFSNELLIRVNSVTKRNFKFENVLINCQSTLQDNEPHHDSADTSKYTFVVYLNTQWDIQWGGMTVILDAFADRSEKIVVNNLNNHKSFFPVPNMGILFPSNLIHFGFAPTKKCPESRYILSYRIFIDN
jgi:hypothetical protein